jgi:hypothetical protein
VNETEDALTWYKEITLMLKTETQHGLEKAAFSLHFSIHLI